MISLKKIEYINLSSKQKEIYNYQKVSAIFANFGICCIKLSDDWNGADFIAVDLKGESINIQLKARVTFAEKYHFKNLYICFPDRKNNKWYLFPHDETLERFNEIRPILNQPNWEKNKDWHSDNVPHDLLPIINEFELVEEKHA